MKIALNNWTQTKSIVQRGAEQALIGIFLSAWVVVSVATAFAGTHFFA